MLRRAKSVRPRGLPGWRAYAVGDVHGRFDLLQGLLRQIEADHLERGGNVRPLLIFLGDLIDRGPQSCEVVELLSGEPLANFRTIVLAGNHEEVLLRLLDGEKELLAQWLCFGGEECLDSYGIDALELLALPSEQAVTELRARIPQAHQRFLRELVDSLRFGDYLFVHAGIRPGVPLNRQSPLDFRWIRQPFLSDRRDHGVTVVHGHTISERIEERSNRIGIDTGAYHYGTLTALAIEEEARWFLQHDEHRS